MPVQVDKDKCLSLALGEAVDNQGLYFVAFASVSDSGVRQSQAIMRPLEALKFSLLALLYALKGLCFQR